MSVHRSEAETEGHFEYDVALSFVYADEALAQRLCDLLQDRYKVFIYSRAQEELAGRDGEVKFGGIFSEGARVVVVFARPEWGSTPFTRIEETAIRNRAFESGYDFTLFVPTTRPAFVPRYVPKARLYYDLERFGDSGLAATVAHLAQEFGGTSRPESRTDRSARLERELAFQERRRRFLRDPESGKAVSEEAIAITQSVRDWATSNAVASLRLELNDPARGGGLLIVYRLPRNRAVSFTVGFRMPYTNVLEDIRLMFRVWDGAADWPGVIRFPDDECKVAKAVDYQCDLGRNDRICWNAEGETQMYSADEIANEICRSIMDQIEAMSSARKGI